MERASGEHGECAWERPKELLRLFWLRFDGVLKNFIVQVCKDHLCIWALLGEGEPQLGDVKV